MSKPILAITMGDPGGIGPEVILKSLQNKPNSKVTYLIMGSPEPFSHLKRRFSLSFDQKQIRFLNITEEAKAISGLKNPEFKIGKICRDNAALAFASMKVASDLAVRGKISGIVTAPVNKTAMRLIQKDFHGHTEFLANAAGAKKFAMMFVGDKLKVTLVTIHVAIKNVSRLITRENVLDKIVLTHQFLKTQLKIKNPKIAVCALNPHGKETGTEDEAQILPAVFSARKKGIQAAGPLSADQLFHDAYEGRFDAVISMYHDQGLAPFKMISFRDGVNVTLGLPYIRTSPDHGTAFDIAYQGKADPSSMISSIRLAEKLVLV